MSYQLTHLEDDDEVTRGVDRVLITGAVREIPLTVAGVVEEGGFVLGPFGGPIQQNLLKRERQGDDWLDTELGNVLFLGQWIFRMQNETHLTHNHLADHIEDALNIIIEMVEIDNETIERIEELVVISSRYARGYTTIERGRYRGRFGRASCV